MKCYVDNKIGALEALIKENHSELMKTVGVKDYKSEKHIGGISTPHIVDDYVEKGNVDPQPTSDQFFQQPISPIHMDFATIYHDIDVPAVEKDDTSIKEHAMEESTEVLPITHHSDLPKNEILHDKEVEDARVEANESDTKVLSGNKDVADTIQQDFEKYASNPIIVDTSNSTTSASISSGTEVIIDALVYGLPNQLINARPLSVIIPLQIIGSDDFLSNNQLPTQLPVKEPAHNLDKKTRASRNRMPSKIMQSPYLTSFGSSDKGKEKIKDDIRPYTPFV
ncbi:hypothetical protein MTR67_043919 [Solanum verrucosum]|uniref:Uncharacterized protein n=1 Tax=Solanum verrucosum TaxID=315347 RepID=A0AAF0USI8_SOLVR|nr:hypothetical protein MTR67_043919 [Solanum verrucosum]